MTLVDRLPQWLSGNESACSARDTRDVSSILGLGRCPGGGNAAHSSILAWRIPRTESGGIWSMESHTHNTGYKQVLGDYILGAG